MQINLVYINEKSNCDKKYEDVLEEVTPQKTVSAELSEIFHNIENVKDEMLESDPNLQMNITGVPVWLSELSV